MRVSDFVASIPHFDGMPPNEQIKLFGWFLHTYGKAERFSNDSIRACFRDADMKGPDISVYLPRLAEKNPPEILKDGKGYRLAGNVRRALDEKYGLHPTTIVVNQLLSDLPAKLPYPEQKEFLDEALNCYRIRAFRASIVMAWNLAYDHLLRWLAGDALRLATFNNGIASKFPKNPDRITALVDFEKFKEWEILAALRNSGLVPKNIVDILDEKLKRRNAAAHPSRITIDQPLADLVITDLVRNVVLLLK
jgi:hypothetical protein